MTYEQMTLIIREFGFPVFISLIIIAIVALGTRAVWGAMLPRLDAWKAQEYGTLEKTHQVMRENSIAGLEISRNNSATLQTVATGMNATNQVIAKMNEKLDVLITTPACGLSLDESELIRNLRKEQRLSSMRLSHLARANEAESTIAAEDRRIVVQSTSKTS